MVVSELAALCPRLRLAATASRQSGGELSQSAALARGTRQRAGAGSDRRIPRRGCVAAARERMRPDAAALCARVPGQGGGSAEDVASVVGMRGRGDWRGASRGGGQVVGGVQSEMICTAIGFANHARPPISGIYSAR